MTLERKHTLVRLVTGGILGLLAISLLGGLLNGMDLSEACRTAVDFTHKVIETTRERSADIRFGPKFEVHLPELARIMEDFRAGTV